MQPNQEAPGKAGRSIPDFCDQVGIARPTYYTIPEELKPATVQIGRKVIITEDPADWLERVRKAGGVKSRKAKNPAAGAAA